MQLILPKLAEIRHRWSGTWAAKLKVMRAPWQHRKSAFTLVELLVVIAIIAILAALLLPALTRGKARAQRVECISDLKQLGLAFQMFAHDHQGRYPMQVPIADGGSMELVQAGENINGAFYFTYRHFQTLANEMVATKPLFCPADIDRDAALSFNQLQNSNLSYFVGVNADYNLPMSILAGDRNITNKYSTPSLVRGQYGLRFTGELHVLKGNILFSDTHVGELNNDNLDFSGSPLASSTFFLPTVRLTMLAGGSSPPSGGGGGPPGGGPPGGGPPSSGPPTSPPQGGGGGPTPSSGGGGPGSGMAGGPGPSSGGVQYPTGIQTSTQPAGNRGAGASAQLSQPAAPLDNSMDSSQVTGHESSPVTVTEVYNAEPGAVPGTNGTRRAAARTADDEPEPPLLWLMGAAKSAGARAGWWWVPILLALLAAVYLYARLKMREREKDEE